MNKFQIGDKVKYEWGTIPGIWIYTHVLNIHEAEDDKYWYTVSSGTTIPEELLIKVENHD